MASVVCYNLVQSFLFICCLILPLLRETQIKSDVKQKNKEKWGFQNFYFLHRLRVHFSFRFELNKPARTVQRDFSNEIKSKSMLNATNTVNNIDNKQLSFITVGHISGCRPLLDPSLLCLQMKLKYYTYNLVSEALIYRSRLNC